MSLHFDLTLPTEPERIAVARVLFVIYWIFAIGMVIADLAIDNETLALITAKSEVLVVVIAAILTLGFARTRPRDIQVLYFATFAYAGNFFAGSQLISAYPELAGWIGIWPFIFFHLAGPGLGAILSIMGLAAVAIACLAPFPPPISDSTFLHASMSMICATILGYLYERIRLRQAKNLATEHGRLKAALARLEDKEVQLTQMAHHDQLTGLPNRRLFMERLECAVLRASQDGPRIALLYLDLDGFKPVNDSLGHQCGDTLLRHVAKRLGSCLRENDCVARMGGDEFTVLLASLDNADNALIVAEKILNVLAEPFVLEGKIVQISASIGVARHPEHGADGEELLRNADAAMYESKREGKNRIQFSPSLAGAASNN